MENGVESQGGRIKHIQGRVTVHKNLLQPYFMRVMMKQIAGIYRKKCQMQQGVFVMKQTAQVRNIILYILAALTVFAGVLSGESRVQPGALAAAANAEDACYRIYMGGPIDDEVCTEKMIGADTKLPAIRAVRPLRRVFRALLAAVYACAAGRTAYMEEFLRYGECQAQSGAQGLVTTIQYIHDLDGKKSA